MQHDADRVPLASCHNMADDFSSEDETDVAYEAPRTVPETRPEEVYKLNAQNVFEHQCPPDEGCNQGHATRQYLLKTVQPVVLEGLRILERERPEDPRKWFGEFLLKYDRMMRENSIDGTFRHRPE